MSEDSRVVVRSPVDVQQKDAFEDLGFVFEPDDIDPQRYCKVTLPNGWTTSPDLFGPEFVDTEGFARGAIDYGNYPRLPGCMWMYSDKIMY